MINNHLKNKQLILLIFLLPFCLIAQQKDKIEINGLIIEATSENIEGVNIYNKTTHEGAISNSEGQFTINVSLNDSLHITAIQYKPVFVIVNEAIIESKEMIVNLNSKINELGEVLVQNNNTTQGWDLSYKTLEFGYEFSPDAQTSIPGNKAAEALNDRTLKNGLNFVELFKLLLPKKKESIRKINNEKENLFYAFKQQITITYISENFKIPLEKVDDFIYFMVDNGLKKDLLKKGNEIRLLDFINQQSSSYKER